MEGSVKKKKKKKENWQCNEQILLAESSPTIDAWNSYGIQYKTGMN